MLQIWVVILIHLLTFNLCLFRQTRIRILLVVLLRHLLHSCILIFMIEKRWALLSIVHSTHMSLISVVYLISMLHIAVSTVNMIMLNIWLILLCIIWLDRFVMVYFWLLMHDLSGWVAMVTLHIVRLHWFLAIVWKGWSDAAGSSWLMRRLLRPWSKKRLLFWVGHRCSLDLCN